MIKLFANVIEQLDFAINRLALKSARQARDRAGGFEARFVAAVMPAQRNSASRGDLAASKEGTGLLKRAELVA